MARRPGAPAAYGEEFSFVSPLVKYLLFFFNMLFWVSLRGRGGTRPAEHPGGWSAPPAAGQGASWDPGCGRAWERHCLVFRLMALWGNVSWGGIGWRGRKGFSKDLRAFSGHRMRVCQATEVG